MTSDYFWWFLTFQEYRFTLKDSWFQNVLLVRKLLPRNQRNYFWISALKFFCSFLGASWKLFGLPGDIVSNIIHKEAYRKPQKASRKVQKNSGQKSRNNFVGFLEEVFWPRGHSEINWPLAAFKNFLTLRLREPQVLSS